MSKNPPRVFRAQKVVGQLQKETRPAFQKGMVVSGPEDLVVNTLADYMGARATEVFVVLYLSVKNAVVGYNEYTGGGVASVEVNVSDVIRNALLSGGAGIITIHNHPSGNAVPSDDDRLLWARIRKASEIVGIPVVDNMVVGDGEYFSESNGRVTSFESARRAAERVS